MPETAAEQKHRKQREAYAEHDRRLMERDAATQARKRKEAQKAAAKRKPPTKLELARKRAKERQKKGSKYFGFEALLKALGLKD